ncbi:hypothetical protein SBOR_2195 [Sclerotinia borealis F-4128]|uniref:F-box domain-containing protein n=1 Tax=Sclerotinia borealis (strain F-4128) TaxID=1432307 RepID=W9CKV2_SCLBF|nr:hypothetical protein SBOR_2195 [Sclerotinia borealis F-4128]
MYSECRPDMIEQSSQSQQQDHEEDIDVEDTVVSLFVKGNSWGKFWDADALAELPAEVVTMIMNELGHVSQLCFSLTSSRYRQLFKLSNFDSYIHGYCHTSNSIPEGCYAARLSLPMTIQESKCRLYCYDLDKCCFTFEALSESDDREKWYPPLATLLWDERFFWSGGGQWCEGCWRALPPTSWDRCAFENDFWDNVANPSVFRLDPYRYITSLLAQALIQGLKTRKTASASTDINYAELRQVLLKKDGRHAWDAWDEEWDEYVSREILDFDYTQCTKCRVKKIITDNGRRREGWNGWSMEWKNIAKEADGVAMIGGLHFGDYPFPYLFDILEWNDRSNNESMMFVLWEDVFRECGLFVKKYEKVDRYSGKSYFGLVDGTTPTVDIDRVEPLPQRDVPSTDGIYTQILKFCFDLFIFIISMF